MPLPRTRPGGHVLMGTGEKITSADLAKIGTMAEQTVYHLLTRLCQATDGTPISGFVGEDCKVSISSGLTMSVGAGMGFFYDTGDSDEFGPCYKPIVVSTAVSTTLDAHNSSARIDGIFLAPLLEEDQSESRSVKDGSGTVTAQSVNKRARWSYALQVVKGTPATNPSAPATPSGYLRICNARVPATTGAVTLSDTRPRLAFGPDLKTDPGTDYAANFVSPGGLAATAGTGLSVGVTRGEAVIQGYRYRYPRQILTIGTADPSSSRYDAIVADADGTLKILAGTPGFGSEPPAGSSQVKLAVVEVLAAATSVTVADLRDSSWLESASIRSGAVTAKKLSVVPVVPALTRTSADGASPAVFTVQATDPDGQPIARSVRMIAEFLTDELAPGGVGDIIGETGNGTLVSSSTKPRILFDTGANGDAQLALVSGTYGVGHTAYLRVTPVNTPGSPSILGYTT